MIVYHKIAYRRVCWLYSNFQSQHPVNLWTRQNNSYVFSILLFMFI
jgi:hypothetical protein